MKSLKTRSLLGAIAATASAALFVVGAAMPAQADTSDGTASGLSASDAQTLRDSLTKFDVPEAQQDALIAKAAAGQVWDASLPSSVPVSEETNVVKGGFNYDVKRFADGSVAAVGLQIPAAAPTGGIQPRGISQCHYQNGSGYSTATGCQIDGTWGTVFAGAINVGYTLVNGGLDRVLDSGYGFQRCAYPTTCSSPSRVAYKAVENSTAAYAKFQADVSAPYLGSWNVWVQLNAGGDTAWMSNS